MKFCLAPLLFSSAAAFLAPSTKSIPVKTSVNAHVLSGWVPDETKFAYGLPGSLDPKEDFDPLGFAENAYLGQMQSSTKSIPVKTSVNAQSLNGWVPDETKFAYGLPGSLEPKEYFDPLGFAENADLGQMKSYREAETTHGRVAMLAVIGALVTEAPLKFHPLFDTGPLDIGPSILHLDYVRVVAPFLFEILAVAIGGVELLRALKTLETPGNEDNLVLKEDYYPGDIGFDPLGLKPDNWEEFSIMSTKELQHGRLAMLGIAGIVAQELTDGQEVFVHLGLAPNYF